MNFRELLSKSGTFLLETLYPSQISCMKCGRDVFEGELFCAECQAKIVRNDKRFCPKCGMPTSGDSGPCIRCIENVNYFEEARSVFVYDEQLKPVLRRFKENGERYLAEGFARAMFAYMKEYELSADVLTFVPLTGRKRRRRGYNQSEELARELSKLSGIPFEPMLEKVAETEEQKSLDFSARQENLRGKFRLVRPRVCETRRVLLLDDVMTTTATANECCRVLSKVCENGVKVLTICTTLKKIRSE